MELDYWYEEYLNKMSSFIESTGEENNYNLQKATQLINQTSFNGNKIIIVGNGGSAAIASHVAVDLTKTARIRAITFNDADLLTCFGNDYGYENWVSEALEAYADQRDLVILISSSGKSPNIVNAAYLMFKNRIPFITFSGFEENNPLRELGTVNFWVDSRQYNFVEMTHQAWLLAIVDRIAEDNKK